MKRIARLLATLLIGTSTAMAQSGGWTESSLNGMTYEVLLPPNYNPSTSYPTVLVLHQLDMGSDWKDLQSEFTAPLQAAQQAHPSIMVMPLLNQTADPSGQTINWGGVSSGVSQGGQQALDVLAQVQKTYNTNPAQVYVTGASMGAQGADSLLIAHGPNSASPIFAAGLTMAGIDISTAPAQAAAALGNTPIIAVHGSNDTTNSPSWDTAMAAADPSFKLTTIQGAGHDVWDGATGYGNAALWNQLFANTLTPFSAATANAGAGAATTAAANLATITNAAAVASSPQCAGVGNGFNSVGGHIFTPNSKVFVAHGINVMEGDEPSVSALQLAFPGVNFVRLAIYDYASPAALQAYVNQLTAAGIVVELEDHNNGAGNAGGSQGVIFTGQQLQTELTWYSAIGAAFKSNPYVWFGTNNEPSETNPATGQMDPAALSTWQQQTYQAIRGAGNNSPIMLEVNGWADPASFAQGYTPSIYANMINVIADIHDYGWLTSYSTDQATNSNFLTQAIAATQQKLPTASGTIPVIIGEYGNSTTGMSIDQNGVQAVNAVQAAVQGGNAQGSAAWAWGSGNPGDGLLSGNGLSAYGQQVASYIKATAAQALAGLASTCTAAVQTVAAIPQPATGAAIQSAIDTATAKIGTNAASAPTAAPTGSAPTLTTLSPGAGTFIDAGGNVWDISKTGSVQENGAYIPGGGGTAALMTLNGVVYGLDAQGKGWFALSENTQYWSGSADPTSMTTATQ